MKYLKIHVRKTRRHILRNAQIRNNLQKESVRNINITEEIRLFKEVVRMSEDKKPKEILEAKLGRKRGREWECYQ